MGQGEARGLERWDAEGQNAFSILTINNYSPGDASAVVSR